MSVIIPLWSFKGTGLGGRHSCSRFEKLQSSIFNLDLLCNELPFLPLAKLRHWGNASVIINDGIQKLSYELRLVHNLVHSTDD